MEGMKVRKFLVSLVFILTIAHWALAADGQTPATGTDATPQASANPPVEVVEPTYPIGPGDILGISVWKDEALTKDVVVLPDGVISFPLLGLIHVAGKTVAQLKAELEDKIQQYVPEPVVNVEVKQVNSMVVFVIGRVNLPGAGRLVLNSNLNVLQALAMAGGLNPFAKRNSIKVFRKEGEETLIFRFHYDDVVEGKRLEENIQLKRFDVIVVP
jgi:polysaccharide export outer membrane protein